MKQVREVFEGCAEIHDGFAWANDKPGWGMEVNLRRPLRRYPCDGSQATLAAGSPARRHLREGIILSMKLNHTQIRLAPESGQPDFRALTEYSEERGLKSEMSGVYASILRIFCGANACVCGKMHSRPGRWPQIFDSQAAG